VKGATSKNWIYRYSKSINDYIERRLAAEAVRRGRAASYGDDQSRP